MEAQRSLISLQLGGIDPELVLVLEIITDVVDFSRAIAEIPGFQFLAEIDEVDVPGDGAFVDLAIQMLPLMELCSSCEQSGGIGPTSIAMEGLSAEPRRKIPLWDGADQAGVQTSSRRSTRSASHRLRGTGVIEDFQERIGADLETVTVEIELWFRRDAVRRVAAENAVRDLVSAANGETLASATIAEIAYHGLLARLPISAIRPMVEDNPETVALARAEEIAFLRPQAQAGIALVPIEKDLSVTSVPELNVLDEPPLVGFWTAFRWLAMHFWMADWKR